MRRSARPAIMIVVLIVIIALAARKIDLNVVVQSVTHAWLPLVIVTGVITFISTLLKGIRWWLFLRKSSEIKLGRVIRLTILGTGANSVLFANAGDMIRIGLVAREARVPIATVVSTLASDKVVELLAFTSVIIVALGAQMPDVVRDRVQTVATVLLLGFGAAAIVVWIAKGRLLAWLSQTKDLLRGRTVLITYAISVLSWGVQIATYAIGATAVGLKVSLSGVVATVVSVNVAGVLRSTPGNVGVFQLMFAVALAPFGIAHEAAVAAAVLIQSAQMLSAIIAGAVAVGGLTTRKPGCIVEAHHFPGDPMRSPRKGRGLSGVLLIVLATALIVSPASSGAQGKSASAPMSPDIQKAKAALAKYSDPLVAVRDGYYSTVACIDFPKGATDGPVTYPPGAMGVHLLNTANIGPKLDPTKPQVLIYEQDGDKLKLTAAEWFMPVGLAGGKAPSIFGQTLQGPMDGHEPIMPASLKHYDLHLWLWKNNPRGMFTPTNSSIKCAPKATYTVAIGEHHH